MIKLDFTQKDIDELNYLRFHHPDGRFFPSVHNLVGKIEKLERR